MGVERIRYYNFRNIADSTIEFSAPEVFLVGENGQGKSNVLESFYLLCYGSSFRTHKDSILPKRGSTSAKLSGQLKLHDEDILDIAIRFSSGRKEIDVNGATIVDRREIIRNLPCIVFCHDDIRFVTGSPDHRRWFFNQTLSLYDDRFLDTLRRYTRVLKSRNAAIRNEQYELLDAYDPQLAETGIDLTRARLHAASEFSGLFEELYHRISGFNSPLTIEYRPSWHADAGISDVCTLFAETRDRDARMRTTTQGPHRDRFRFLMDGREFTETASTGQLRLISLVLRIAQSRFFTMHSSRKPLLLLDDVMLELDPVRRERFFNSLPEYDQAVFTFLPDEQFSPLRRSDTLVYRVTEGEIHGES